MDASLAAGGMPCSLPARTPRHCTAAISPAIVGSCRAPRPLERHRRACRDCNRNTEGRFHHPAHSHSKYVLGRSSAPLRNGCRTDRPALSWQTTTGEPPLAVRREKPVDHEQPQHLLPFAPSRLPANRAPKKSSSCNLRHNSSRWLSIRFIGGVEPLGCFFAASNNTCCCADFMAPPSLEFRGNFGWRCVRFCSWPSSSVG